MDLLHLQINIYQLMITLHFVRSDHTSVSCPSGNYLTENLILESILKVIKHFLALSLIFPPRPLKRSPCTLWCSRTSLGIFFWQCQVILFQGKQDNYKHILHISSYTIVSIWFPDPLTHGSSDADIQSSDACQLGNLTTIYRVYQKMY